MILRCVYVDCRANKQIEQQDVNPNNIHYAAQEAWNYVCSKQSGNATIFLFAAKNVKNATGGKNFVMDFEITSQQHLIQVMNREYGKIIGDNLNMIHFGIGYHNNKQLIFRIDLSNVEKCDEKEIEIKQIISNVKNEKQERIKQLWQKIEYNVKKALFLNEKWRNNYSIYISAQLTFKSPIKLIKNVNDFSEYVCINGKSDQFILVVKLSNFYIDVCVWFNLEAAFCGCCFCCVYFPLVFSDL